MTSTVNVGRLANIFRGGRWMIIHDLSEIYKPAVTRNKEKLMDIIREKAEIATKSELARKMQVLKGFYTVEMAPPGTGEMAKLSSDIGFLKDFIAKKGFLQLTVRQAWLYFLVGLEVFLWFFIGETIGKGHIVGYLV